MNTFSTKSFNNSYDTIDTLIFKENLRIKSFDIDPFHNTLLVIMNNGTALPLLMSEYPRLKGAPIEVLRNYEIIGMGTGIHWPELDEDLSLRGFIKSFIYYVVKNHPNPGMLADVLYKSA